MVKTALDDYFKQINTIYEKRGLTWSVVPGNFWIELKINRNKKNEIPKVKLPEKIEEELASDEYYVEGDEYDEEEDDEEDEIEDI